MLTIKELLMLDNNFTINTTKKEEFEINNIYNQTFKELTEAMNVDIQQPPLKFNGRLTRAIGQAVLYKDTTRIYIDLSKEATKGYSLDLDKEKAREAIVDTLKHELIHVILFIQGKEYLDGQYTFEKTLADFGISPSGATPKSKRLSTTSQLSYSKAIKYLDKKENTIKYTDYNKRNIDTINSFPGLLKVLSIGLVRAEEAN